VGFSSQRASKILRVYKYADRCDDVQICGMNNLTAETNCLAKIKVCKRSDSLKKHHLFDFNGFVFAQYTSSASMNFLESLRRFEQRIAVRADKLRSFLDTAKAMFRIFGTARALAFN